MGCYYFFGRYGGGGNQNAVFLKNSFGSIFDVLNGVHAYSAKQNVSKSRTLKFLHAQNKSGIHSGRLIKPYRNNNS